MKNANIYACKDVAGASNGQGAVAVIRWRNGYIDLYSYAPRALGSKERRAEFTELVLRAMDKLKAKRR